MSEKTIKSIFDHPDFKQYRDRWEHRLKTLERREAYYDGTAYDRDDAHLFRKLLPQFISGVKPIYLLLGRAVDVDAGIIPAGWEFAEDAPDDWTAARDLVFAWSKWTTEGVLFVDYGARKGLSGLRIADLADEKKIIIQPVDPATFLLIRPDQYSDKVGLSIYVDQRRDAQGESFEYAEVITPEEVATFKDGEPFAFSDRGPIWKNELGFVPFVEIQFKRNGDALSECTFERQIPALDQLNELASDLAEVLKKNKDPITFISGSEPQDLAAGPDLVWFGPAGSKVELIVPGLNIDGTLHFIQDIKLELKESLPELSFDALKQNNQIATETLETQLTELVLKIKRVRPNFDAGLAQALQMAARAASVHNIAGLEPLADEDLEFDPDREILPLDPDAKLDLEMKQINRDQMEVMGRFSEITEPGPEFYENKRKVVEDVKGQ